MAIDAEMERLMRNWARWRSGVPIGLAMTSAYELEARGRREEVSIPLLNGEAMDVDKAVHTLPEELQDALEQYWLKGGTTDQKARRLRCTVMTMYRRLDHAHYRIGEHLRQLKRQAEAVRASLARGRANGGKTPAMVEKPLP